MSVNLPNALERLDDVLLAARDRPLAVFLDYDGTLTPIVERPDLAVLDGASRAVLERLAARHLVAVISGRDADDVRERVGLKDIVYAGSHGFDIRLPDGRCTGPDKAEQAVPALDAVERRLEGQLAGVTGVILERKAFALAVHYRLVDPDEVPRVTTVVDEAVAAAEGLRKGEGKMVYELLPDMEWNKGLAVGWLLQHALPASGAEHFPLFLGDDVTDEDAFAALSGRGLGIVVMETPRPSAARYRLRDPVQVMAFLDALARR